MVTIKIEYPDSDKKKAEDEKNQTPPKLADGIAIERTVTDLFMCIIFALFFLGMFATAAYGYAKGNPLKLLTPYDSKGVQCGRKDNGTQEFKYLFWPDLDKAVNVKSVVELTDAVLGNSYCVKECPLFDLKNNTQCFLNPTELAQNKTCPKAIYNSRKYLNRYCLPNLDNLKNVTKELLGKIAKSDAGRYMGDLATAWWVLLVVGIISAILAFNYLFLLRYWAKPVIFFSFVAIFVLLVGGGFYVYFLADRYEPGDSTYRVMKGMGILIWILAGLYTIILACCYKRIQLGCSIMEAASDFVASTPQVALIPLVFFFIVAAFVVWWVISAIWVFSVGDPEPGTLILANIKWSNTTRYVWIYHLFGLFWISAFIIGCSQFLIASVCALWYFSYGNKADNQGKDNMFNSFRWLWRYHVGSIAFGALIIAIMEMIKVIFEYVRRKYADAIGNNMCTKILVCCVRCCIWCLDYCVKQITKNAFIQIALTGENFCSAAWLSFWLVVRNAGRFTVVEGIGSILMFVGKATVLCLSGWIAYLICMNEKNLKENLQSPIFPVIIVVFIAYLICSVLISLFSFSATTILHCFIIDSELSTKAGRNNSHTPQSLQPFLAVNEQSLGQKVSQVASDVQKVAANTIS